MTQLSFDAATAKALERAYHKRDMIRRRRHVRAALAAAPGERILDVGCGPGFYVRELLDEIGPSGSIVAVDASRDMLDLARLRCEGYDNAAFREGDATALPGDDGEFDAALCVQVMEYVPDPSAALAEIHRVLRPGGRAVIWDVCWATAWWHTDDPDRMRRVLSAWDEHLLMLEMAADFVPGRRGVTGDEVAAWMAEQRDLAERGEFFFEGTQFCFTARRPAREGAL